jgi:hypothetical protein
MKYAKAWANSKREINSFDLKPIDALVSTKSVSNEQIMLDTVKASVDKLFDETFPPQKEVRKKKKAFKQKHTVTKDISVKEPVALDDKVWISFFAILFVVFFLFFVLFQRLQNIEQTFVAWRSSIPTLK